MGEVTISAQIAYDVAMKRLIQKERELVELTALYNELVQQCQQLQQELQQFKEGGVQLGEGE